MARRKNVVPSIRKELNLSFKMPITDPRVQKTIDWINEQNKTRKAAMMARELLISALNGELGPTMQTAVEVGDVELAREAAAEMKAFFVVEDDDDK